MIILNNEGTILYRFSYESLLDAVIKPLIIRKAYKGYVYYNTLEDKDAVFNSFAEFCEMDLWKIKFSFQIYLEQVKKAKRLGFNPSNKTLIKHILR